MAFHGTYRNSWFYVYHDDLSDATQRVSCLVGFTFLVRLREFRCFETGVTPTAIAIATFVVFCR